MAVRLAAILIVKNEAKHLAACLDSLHQWVDEIIILDAGSTDATATIAKTYTPHFFVQAQWQGFGIQRQIAQSYATADWVLWIDADERVSPELRSSILQAIQQPPSTTLFAMPRRSWVFGRFINHSGWYPDHVIRLYPRTLTQYNAALVHEKVELPAQAKVDYLSGDLLHFTYDNLQHYLTKSAHYADLWATQRATKGKSSSISQGIAHALACFIKMYVLKAGFLDGKQGLLLALLSAHSTFCKYADLWIKTQTVAPNSQSVVQPSQD